MKYFVFCIIICVCSCKKKAVEERDYLTTIQTIQHVINIDELSNKNKLNISELLIPTEEFKLIELECEENNIIFAGIDKVKHIDENILVLDSKTTSLVLFNNKGKFLKRIGKIGEGPGEYQDIIDFQVDSKRKEIIVLSPRSQSVLKYNYNGDYLNKLTLDFFPNNFIITEDGNYMFMSNYSNQENHLLYITDTNGNTLNYDFPFPKTVFLMMFGSTGSLQQKGLNPYFTPPSSSIIYSFSNNGMSPIYRFNFGPTTWKEENIFKLEEFNQVYEQRIVSYLTEGYIDTKDVIAFSYLNERWLRTGYYFKNSKKTYVTGINLEHDVLAYIVGLPVGVENDRFISTFNSENYLSSINSKLSEEFKQSPLYPKLKTIETTENPYLIYFKFK